MGFKDKNMSYGNSYDTVRGEDTDNRSCGICGRRLDSSNRSSQNSEYCKYCMPGDGEELEDGDL